LNGIGLEKIFLSFVLPVFNLIQKVSSTEGVGSHLTGAFSPQLIEEGDHPVGSNCYRGG
jgi:hypothetical protein